MPCDYKKYPADWKGIVAAIKERANDRCELCNVLNGAYILRRKNIPSAWDYCSRQDADALKPMGRVVKIVLTVHHIDFDVKNNAPYNLLALCQRCHNKLDMPLRIRNRNRKNINGR